MLGQVITLIDDHWQMGKLSQYVTKLAQLGHSFMVRCCEQQQKLGHKLLHRAIHWSRSVSWGLAAGSLLRMKRSASLSVGLAAQEGLQRCTELVALVDLTGTTSS